MKSSRRILPLILTWLSLTSGAAAQLEADWTRFYNGSGSGLDQAKAIALDGDGHLYVLGQGPGGNAPPDVILLKYAANGDLLWDRSHDGPNNDSYTPYALALDTMGNAFIAGVVSGLSGFHGFLMKYEPDGDTSFTRIWEETGTFSKWSAMTTTPSGEFVYLAGSHLVGSFQMLVGKYTTDGDTVWTRRLGFTPSSTNNAIGIGLDSSGNLYVCGTTTDVTGDDIVIAKYSPEGDTVWTRRFNGPDAGNDVASAFVVTQSGFVHVTGTSVGATSFGDFVTLKYDSSGTLLWSRLFNGLADTSDNSNAIAVDMSGGVFVTGSSWGELTFADCLTIKYNAQGDSLWADRYDKAPGYTHEEGRALCLSGAGDVYVTGQGSQTNGERDLLLIHYDGLDGNRRDVLGVGGPGDGVDAGTAITSDNQGFVTVAGFAYFDGERENDIIVARFRPTVSAVRELPGSELPANFELHQNEPNPFNSSTTIRFDLSEGGPVRLEIFDVLGRRVLQDLEPDLLPSTYAFTWDGRDGTGSPVASGVYLYRLTTRTVSESRKMVLLK